MNIKIKKVGIISIVLMNFLCCNNFTSAQEDRRRFNPLEDQIADFLPSLSELLDSAVINDPYVDFRQYATEINKKNLISTKRNWSRTLGVQADFRYGTFDNYSINDAAGSNPSVLYATRTEFKFGYAAYINFPLYELYNRHNLIELNKIEIEQARSMVKVQQNQRRETLIRQYNDLILAHELFKIKAKYLETSRINLQMVEKEFVNGVISVTEFARLSEIASRTEADYVSAKSNMLTAFMLLEETVGMKFNISKDIR